MTPAAVEPPCRPPLHAERWVRYPSGATTGPLCACTLERYRALYGEPPLDLEILTARPPDSGAGR